MRNDFNAYIESLPEWERHLLHGIVIHVSPEDMVHQFTQEEQSNDLYLLLVSDGSVQHSRLTYGWVFGSSDNIVYAEHAGPGYGEPTSHRAEGWGLLSGALFIRHLYQFLSTQELPLVTQIDTSDQEARV